jgi:hypothetical protein
MERKARYLSIGKQFLGAIWIAIPQQIFTQQTQFRINGAVYRQVASIHNTHIHTSL